MTYQERPIALPGAVLWRRCVGPAPEVTRILPDGCLDLLWDGRRLLVAGPDTTARQHQGQAGASYVGLRMAGGTGPALLGVPANSVRDQTPDLADLWSSGNVRVLAERVAADPIAALEAWAVERARSREVDPFGPRLLRMAATGTPVAVMADRLGLSPRQLHRRCLPIFGYGARRLARVLRLGRAVQEARTGVPLAQVAAGSGYADQAHLSREIRALAGTTPRGLLLELARSSQRSKQVDWRAVR
ncbi:MAG: helix-turn-helix domain-containing protein, partial [Candidatus Dormibacteraeota bacterium]|nr:helix-turn-helix domain-containing protein [Candidatus Dormibacteraeota bacterium]